MFSGLIRIVMSLIVGFQKMSISIIVCLHIISKYKNCICPSISSVGLKLIYIYIYMNIIHCITQIYLFHCPMLLEYISYTP